ncbi:MAG: hypothetical protein LBP74_10775 [Treponema sp.]|jgi:hypothetical protein|nr:hypothetical protein [Treponema sp.]
MSGELQPAKSEDFEIVDRPPEAEDDKPVRETDILQSLLSGKAVQKTLKTSRGEFVARYPNGKERLRIDQLRAVRRRGIPAESFDDQANMNNNVWSTLDVVIVDGPDWYKKARNRPEGWSWEDGPDEELTIELYNLVRSFRLDIAEKIKRSKLGRPVEKIERSPDTAPVDGGPFSGLTNGPEGAGLNG